MTEQFDRLNAEFMRTVNPVKTQLTPAQEMERYIAEHRLFRYLHRYNNSTYFIQELAKVLPDEANDFLARLIKLDAEVKERFKFMPEDRLTTALTLRFNETTNDLREEKYSKQDIADAAVKFMSPPTLRGFTMN